jgi:hypothetical protein
MKSIGILLLTVVLASTPPLARTIKIEKLTGNVDPKRAFLLEGLSCRNLDKVVHITISIDWPQDKTSTNDGGRFIFWTDETEFLFPQSKVSYLHGDYTISGYFITRSGGTHQGITSMAFEAVDDASVVLNSNVKEVPAKKIGCV